MFCEDVMPQNMKMALHIPAIHVKSLHDRHISDAGKVKTQTTSTIRSNLPIIPNRPEIICWEVVHIHVNSAGE